MRTVILGAGQVATRVAQSLVGQVHGLHAGSGADQTACLR